MMNRYKCEQHDKEFASTSVADVFSTDIPCYCCGKTGACDCAFEILEEHTVPL